MYTIENSVAEKIISDFKKFGYNAKLKSAIYRCKGMSCFGGILRRISINCDELISCIFDDKEIKLGYDELKSLKTFQRKDWINRNKKDKNSLIQKTISKLQADLNAEEIEMARHDDVQWAVYQYMNGFGGTNDDIMNPDGIAWVFNRQEVLPSNNGKGKTAEEIIVNELKNGGEYLATYLGALTYFNSKQISADFAKIVLDNNPSVDVLSELLFGFYFDSDVRYEVAKVFAKKAPAEKFEHFINYELEKYRKYQYSDFNKFFYDYNTFLNNSRERYNHLKQELFKKEDYFDWAKDNDSVLRYSKMTLCSYDPNQELRDYVDHWYNKTYEVFADAVTKRLRTSDEMIMLLRCSHDDLLDLMLKSIEKNLSLEEIETMYADYNKDASMRWYIERNYPQATIDLIFGDADAQCERINDELATIRARLSEKTQEEKCQE